MFCGGRVLHADTEAWRRSRCTRTARARNDSLAWQRHLADNIRVLEYVRCYYYEDLAE